MANIAYRYTVVFSVLRASISTRHIDFVETFDERRIYRSANFDDGDMFSVPVHDPTNVIPLTCLAAKPFTL